MVGGPLGSGLENDRVVQQAAYGERQRTKSRERNSIRHDHESASSAWKELSDPPKVARPARLIRFGCAREQTVMSRKEKTSTLRWPIAAALLVAAGAHVPVIPEHLREAPYMGVLFVGFTVLSAALAIVIAVRGSAPTPFVVAGVLCGAAIAAYCLTRLVAFPQLGDDVGNWGEPAGVVSIVSEAVVVLLSVACATWLRRTPRGVAASAAPNG